MIYLQISTSDKDQLLDITSQVSQHIPDNFTGIIQLYVPHTSAAIAINEGADPAVKTDILSFLNDLIPWNYDTFNHAEGNSAAHIKALLVGNSQQVLVENGDLQLGTWEKIFFCEFDGPRHRKIWMMLNEL